MLKPIFHKRLFFPHYPTKYYYLKELWPILNNVVTNKIEHFPQLFALSPQIPLKLKWHYFHP